MLTRLGMSGSVGRFNALNDIRGIVTSLPFTSFPFRFGRAEGKEKKKEMNLFFFSVFKCSEQELVLYIAYRRLEDEATVGAIRRFTSWLVLRGDAVAAASEADRGTTSSSSTNSFAAKVRHMRHLSKEI